jgi:biopolymer transport protein ExbB/TolQ
MEFDLVAIVHKMNIFALLVAGALGLMAVLALTIFVERSWAYFRSRRRSHKFGPTAARLLERGDHQGLLREASEAKPSYLTSMLAYGMKTYTGRRPRSAGCWAARAGSGDAGPSSARPQRGLDGSTAPFVGLLGTVIGIIGAFQGIAARVPAT